MIFSLILSTYLAYSAGAFAPVHGRQEFNTTTTISIAIPTQAKPFTSTIPECSTVSPIVLEGVTTRKFRAGTTTIFVPPQALPTTTTIIDTKFNASEILIIMPLQGTCADYPVPPPLLPTPTNSTILPVQSKAICPDRGNVCRNQSMKVEGVVEDMNKGIMLLQFLRGTAKSLNGGQAPGGLNDSIVAQPQPDIKGAIKNLKLALEKDDEDPPFAGAKLSNCEKRAVTVTFVRLVRTTQGLFDVAIDAIDSREFDETPFDFAGVIKFVLYALSTLADLLPSEMSGYKKCIKQQRKDIDGMIYIWQFGGLLDRPYDP